MRRGYITSGRMMADYWRDQIEFYHDHARWCLRNGMIGAGKYELRQALRALRQYRFYLGRIDA